MGRNTGFDNGAVRSRSSARRYAAGFSRNAMLIAIALVIGAALIFFHSLPKREYRAGNDLDSLLSTDAQSRIRSSLSPRATLTARPVDETDATAISAADDRRSATEASTASTSAAGVGVAAQTDPAAPSAAPAAAPTAEPAQTQPAEPPEASETPRRFSIAGQVLDDEGVPVPGIDIVAKATRLFDPDDAAADFAGDLQAFSGFSGHFYFTELPDGEYRLSTVESEDYPVAQLAVRAGEQSANLVLSPKERFKQQIHGVVETTDGRPLSGVRVAAMLSGSEAVLTRADGGYEIAANIRQDAGSYSVRYQREGYAEVRVRIKNTNPKIPVRSDVVMERLGTLTTVDGVLTGPRGEPVAGALVRIHSTSLGRSHQAVSDRWGRFWMSEVEIGDDYRLWINPKHGFRDYSQARVQVPSQGLELNVALDPVDRASLKGQMLDSRGEPIPHFTLTLRSLSALWHSVPVSGDEEGRFVVDSAPDGGLTFTTHSTPALQVIGIDAAPGETADVNLVLDWGHHDVFGQVLDTQGMPVPTPDLTLTWSHSAGTVKSLSTRRTQADADGRFSFSRLGPGRHTLRVTAPGYRSAVVNVDPADQVGDLLLRLEEVSL